MRTLELLFDGDSEQGKGPNPSSVASTTLKTLEERALIRCVANDEYGDPTRRVYQLHDLIAAWLRARVGGMYGGTGMRTAHAALCNKWVASPDDGGYFVGHAARHFIGAGMAAELGEVR